jgi:hypothetical protein
LVILFLSAKMTEVRIGEVMIEETTNKGEVYFIGEKEIGGRVNHTGYFKIGMVAKEGETERRLKEHQTGNPRELFIHEKIATQQPFWVESSLHQRYGKKRTRAEWHAFNPEELEEVIAEAQTLADRVETHYPYIRERETLQKKVSNGKSVPADQDFSGWFDTLCCAHWALSQLGKDEKRYVMLFKEYEKNVPDTDGESTKDKPTLVTGQRVQKVFDASEFEANYPEIYKKFLEPPKYPTGSLKPVYPKLDQKKKMEQIASLYEFFGGFCSRFEEQYIEVEGKPERFLELDDLYFELKGWISIFTWDKEVALARMACFCGEYNAVIDEYGNNLLTWKREWTEDKKLNQSELKKQHPEEYKEFVTEIISEVTRENKS